MIKEGTPGKYLLRAVEPGSRRPLIESHATRDAVDARRAALERAGYNVVVMLADLPAEGEFLKLEARRIEDLIWTCLDRTRCCWLSPWQFTQLQVESPQSSLAAPS